MVKDIPLTIEILSDDTAEQLRITAAKEIEFVITHIANKGSRVALYYNDANDFILTTVMAVDGTGLWLEQSTNNSENKRITSGGSLNFVSSHTQVKVQFTAVQASDTLHQGRPAFFIALPKSLYRHQRREFFRLMAPLNNLLHCVINAQPKTAAKQTHDFTIMDISCGGVGLICKETGADLGLGLSYPDSHIDLPEVGTINGTIVVKNLAILTTDSGNTQCRAGCAFENLDGNYEILLQRYITSIQLARSKT